MSHIGEEGVHNELTPVYSYIREEWSRLQSSLAGWMTYGVGPAPSVSYVVRDSSTNVVSTGDHNNSNVGSTTRSSGVTRNHVTVSTESTVRPPERPASTGTLGTSVNRSDSENFTDPIIANRCIRVERFAAAVLRRRGATAAAASAVPRSSAAPEPGVATLVVDSRSRMPPSLDVVTREMPEEETSRQNRRQQLFHQIQQRQLRQHEHQRQRHYYLGAVLRDSVLQAAQARVLSTRAQQNASTIGSEDPTTSTVNAEDSTNGTVNPEDTTTATTSSENIITGAVKSEGSTPAMVDSEAPTSAKVDSDSPITMTTSSEVPTSVKTNSDGPINSTVNSSAEGTASATVNPEGPSTATGNSDRPRTTQLRQLLMQQSLIEKVVPRSSGQQQRGPLPRPVTVSMAPSRAASIAAHSRAGLSSAEPSRPPCSAAHSEVSLSSVEPSRAASIAAHSRAGLPSEPRVPSLVAQTRARLSAGEINLTALAAPSRTALSSGEPTPAASTAAHSRAALSSRGPSESTRGLQRGTKRLRARSAEVQRPGALRAALQLLRRSRRARWRQASASVRRVATQNGTETAAPRQAVKRHLGASGGGAVPCKMARPLRRPGKLVSLDLSKDVPAGPSLESVASENLTTRVQHNPTSGGRPLLSRDNMLNRPRPVQVLPQSAVLAQEEAREVPEPAPEDAANGDARWLNLETRQVAHRDYGVPILDQTVNMPRTLRRLINQTIAGLIFGRGDGAVACNILGVNYKIRRWDMRSTSDITVQIANNCVVKQCKIHNDSR